MTATTEEKYTATQLGEYVNKKVTVTRNLAEPNEKGESAVEVEGTVQAGNQLGILIKPKGKVSFDLIPIGEIEEIVLAAEGAKKFKRSKLQLVKVGQARRHLLERHGVQLTWVNTVTEEQAHEYHQSLNHEDLDLGHIHVAKEDADKGDAAGEESDGDE
jgi:hypothetical protein